MYDIDNEDDINTNVNVRVATEDMAADSNWTEEQRVSANPFREGFNDKLKDIYSLYREMWDMDSLLVRFYYGPALFYEVKLNECGVVWEKHYLVVGMKFSNGTKYHSVEYAAR